MSVRRLIAPVTERWNEGERDWSFVKDPSQDIARWEKDTGLTLPDDYRRFMLTYNGGYVYPRLFRPKIEQDFPGEPITFVDPFYSWTTAVMYWRGGQYGRGTPPDTLFIGCDPGGLEILLSLRPEDYGHVFCWVGSRNIWGTDGNVRIWHQAASFEAFLASLHDEPDGSDYASWHIPLYDKLAKPLVF